MLAKTGIRIRQKVINYGRVPGWYTEPLARTLGEADMAYAVEIHPLGLKMVSRLAGVKKGWRCGER